VVVVGCGAIGLSLAVAMAGAGRRVVGVDIDAGRVAALNAGRLDLLDDGLAKPFSDALGDGRLSFQADLTPADASRVYVAAVPTPADAETGWRRSMLDAAMETVGRACHSGELVCIRSTVPIGTTRAYGQGAAFDVACCPDRTVAGRGYLGQFETPHLIGALTASAEQGARALFGTLGPVVTVSDPETAEAIKLFANIQRDVAFALANQFALVCEAAGIDVDEVRVAGAAGYPRFSIPRPGPAGGPCLTKDVHLLQSSAALDGVDISLLLAARATNGGLAEVIAKRIEIQLAACARPAVALLGLAFKGSPPTLDRRGGFADDLVRVLSQRMPDLDLRAWDPAADPGSRALQESVAGADLIVLANDHPALAGAAALAARIAPEATIIDMCGVLGSGHAGSVQRFGAAARRRPR